VRAAGALLAGGHTITDPEPKYGLAVMGVVDPGRVLTNRGARAGDVIVLTKPIGVGVIASAHKRGVASDELVARAVALMTTPNADARDAAVTAGDAVHAATDVTGFGLLGHLRELAIASGVSAHVDAGAVPVLDGVRALLADGIVPGGTRRNRDWVNEVTEWGALDELEQLLLADAQTSGGLLLAVAPDAVDALVADLAARGTHAAAVVGRLTDEGPARIVVS
jgi:selenide,water dikinase